MQTNTLVKDLNIQVPKGEVAFTNEKLLMTGEGTVNNLPVEFEWHENMLKPIQETVVSVWGELPPAMAMKHVERVGLEISDTVSSSFNLKAVGAGQYDFEYMTDLTKNQLTQNDLHWRKGVGQKLDLQASGRLGKGVEVITVDVSATGENNIRLLGAFDMSEKIKADFKTFNIAGHKLKAAIYGEKVNLVGEQLDISSMDILDQTEVLGDVSSSLNSDITINVDKMILKKGQVEKVTGDLKLKGGKWQYIDFKGQNENDGFHFSLKKPSSDHNAIRFTANSVGEVLKEAGLLNTFKKGVLKANADIYTVEGQKEGRGLIKIDKTYMVKAPILAKLLSLISLEELLSSKDGIYFDDVEIPLLFVGDEIITDHAYLSGPSIGLRLRGKINTTKKTVNLEGQLIPAEGLNSFIAKIPLLGDLLTGSQSGLLVADFKVKGSIKDPKVTANPLSFVMPGLVKDFFGTLFNRGDITRPEKGK